MSDLTNLREEIVICRKCPRLVAYREEVARGKAARFADWTYWGRPVPGFGNAQASLMIVGLAPAAHGGNRTGRVFTGDRSGDFLFRCLYKAGFANQPDSVSSGDGLRLNNAYLTAAVKCAPPDNKPTREESKNCSHFLSTELTLLRRTRVILCLGQLAFTQVLASLREKFELPRPRPKFAHGSRISLGRGRPAIIASYHPSPRNTQTGKLTEKMFMSLLTKLRTELSSTQE